MNKLRFTALRGNLSTLAAITCILLAGCDSSEIAVSGGTSAAETPTEQGGPAENTPETPAPESENEPENEPEITPETEPETTPETPVTGNPVNPEQPVGDCTVNPDPASGDGTALNTALTQLYDHLDGSAELTNAQIAVITSSLSENAGQLTGSEALIKQAFTTIDLYDEVYGPLFINNSTAGSISRTSSAASDAIHYAMIALQQGVIDHAYSNRNVRRYQSTLDGQGFATANFFPGSVPDNSATTAPYTVTLNASNNPSPAHRPYGAFSSDSRRPTGAYAAPGAVVAVSVPESRLAAASRYAWVHIPGTCRTRTPLPALTVFH